MIATDQIATDRLLLDALAKWNEQDHPRGGTKNPGQFAKKGTGKKAPAKKTIPTPTGELAALKKKAAEAQKALNEVVNKLKAGNFSDYASGLQHRELVNHHNKTVPLKADETRIVRRYVAGGYVVINRCLRNKENCHEVEHSIDVLRDVISKTSLPEAMTVFRGAALNPELVVEWKVGGTISDRGFVSTSIRLSTAAAFSSTANKRRVIFRIEAPEGLKARAVAPQMGEGEVVMNPGQRFKITAMQKVASKSFTGTVFNVRAL